MVKKLIWDLPLRFFHWLLVAAIATSYYSGLSDDFEAMDLHFLAGQVVLFLILFRLLWGFAAKGNANFFKFVRGPKHVVAYLRGEQEYEGHNPLGALSVIALVLALTIQVTTGLFANDDIMFEGPLAHLIEPELSSSLTGIHEIMMWVSGVLIGLHLGAIFYYDVLKRKGLVKAMITGKNTALENKAPENKALENKVPAETSQSDLGLEWRKGIIVAAIAAAATYGLAYLI